MPDNEFNERSEQTEITESPECTKKAETANEFPEKTDEVQDPKEELTDAADETEAAGAGDDPDTSDAGDAPDETEAAPSDGEPVKPDDILTPDQVYQLFSDNTAARRKERRGAWVYFGIMAAAFAICFAMLIFAVITAPARSDDPPTGTVTVEKIIYVREGDSTGRLSISEIAQKVSPSVVGIAVKKANGSGVGTGIIKTEDGYIITNYHVIEDHQMIEVLTSDGKYHRAEYIGGNELSDVAVIKIEATGLVAAEFGDSDDLIVGETAVAIGTPGGIEYVGTVTTGIISAVNRAVKFYDDTGLLQKTMTLIQTSTQINPGNSGGPLINGDGEVIGINTYKITEDGFEGIGFAIPINGVLGIYDNILAGGTGIGGQIVKKAARLGITGTAVTQGVHFQYYVDGVEQLGRAAVAGVAVASISGSEYDAAAKLQPGDIITAINGRTVTAVDDIRLAIIDMSPGDSVTITAYRDGAEFTVDVILGE